MQLEFGHTVRWGWWCAPIRWCFDKNFTKKATYTTLFQYFSVKIASYTRYFRYFWEFGGGVLGVLLVAGGHHKQYRTRC